MERLFARASDGSITRTVATTDDEVKRAVVYLANHSGASFAEPAITAASGAADGASGAASAAAPAASAASN